MPDHKNQKSKSRSPDLIAYSVTETDAKSYFNRVGAAWENSKGGYGVRLDALPVNGELVLLPPRDEDAPEP